LTTLFWCFSFLFQARSFDNKALKKFKHIAAPDALIWVKVGDQRADRIKPKNSSEDKQNWP